MEYPLSNDEKYVVHDSFSGMMGRHLQVKIVSFTEIHLNRRLEGYALYESTQRGGYCKVSAGVAEDGIM